MSRVALDEQDLFAIVSRLISISDNFVLMQNKYHWSYIKECNQHAEYNILNDSYIAHVTVQFW